MKKYAAVWMYCNGCPVHDHWSYNCLSFYETLEELKEEVKITNPNERMIEEIYNIETCDSEEAWVSYSFHHHSVDFIDFKLKDGSVTRYTPVPNRGTPVEINMEVLA